MTILRTLAVAGAVAFLFGNAAIAQEEHVGPITDYVNANVVPWLSDPVVVDAGRAPNAKNAARGPAANAARATPGRAEIDAASKPMIDATLGNDLSKFLAQKREASGGLITEAFVTDAKGLNVGQSDVTSDYWQGDEAKWQKSFGAGPGAIFVDGVEKDESTQSLQSQVSITISDPATKQAIGAITLGIDVDAL